MLQLKNKRKIYFYLLSLLLLSTFINQKTSNTLKETFLVKQIDIRNLNEEIREVVLDKTKYLIRKNIFVIDKYNISKEINKLNYLEKVKIKKNYPSTIIIDAKKTRFIALTFINQKKYIVGENGNLILANDLDYDEKLPIIFGKFKILDFISLKNELIKYEMNLKDIVKYFYHKNKRWDLYYSNNIVVKLPNKNINQAIKIYKEFTKSNNIKPNSIIDLRISNRLVLKNE